jgi:hypothetical protein
MVSVEIDCGELDAETGRRVFRKYVEFFDREVEVYTVADSEAPHELLFRPIDLAKVLQCHESKVGMTLKRKGDQIAGLYRASGYRHKPGSVLGLKMKSYFLSLQACIQIKEMFEKNKRKSPKRQIKQPIAAPMEAMSSSSLSSFSLTSSSQLSSSSSADQVLVYQHHQVSTPPESSTIVPLNSIPCILPSSTVQFGYQNQGSYAYYNSIPPSFSNSSYATMWPPPPTHHQPQPQFHHPPLPVHYQSIPQLVPLPSLSHSQAPSLPENPIGLPPNGNHNPNNQPPPS